MSTKEDTTDAEAETSSVDEKAGQVTETIRNHAMAAAATGLIPFPALDMAASTTVQIRMVSKLCSIYEIPFFEQATKSVLSSLIMTSLPRATIAYPAISLMKAVPVVGPVLGFATMPALNSGITWALGKTFAWHFANGGTLKDLTPDILKGRFERELKEAKTEAPDAEEVKPAA